MQPSTSRDRHDLQAFGTEVEVSTFETWDAASRTFDAVVAGTAWHWIDPVAGAAKAAQILRPGGRLAPFWHVMQLPAAVVDAFAEVYQRVMPEASIDFGRVLKGGLAAYQPLLTKAAEGIRATRGFEEPEQWRFGRERVYTRDEWLDQLPTFGGNTRLAPQDLARVCEGVDALGGGFTLPYVTAVVTAGRTNR